MQAILLLLFVILYIPVNAILSGLVLNSLWSWFVVPLGAPEISVAHAIGLSLIVSYLTYHKLKGEKVEGDDDTEKVLSVVWHHGQRLAFTWLFGRVVYAFM